MSVTSKHSRVANSVAAPVIKYVNRKSRRSGRTSKADLERHKPKVEELLAGSVYDIWWDIYVGCNVNRYK